MSYTKITIGGEEVGLKFGVKSFRMFLEDCVTKADEYFTGEDLTDYGVAKIIQFAYKNNCLIKEVDPVIPFEEFFNWVDERMEGDKSGELVKVITVWSESRTIRQAVKNSNPDESGEEKKSQPLTTSPSISTPLNESPTGS